MLYGRVPDRSVPSAPPAPEAIAAAARRLAGGRVVVLGDVMLDRYVAGDAARLSPEAPIPVLRPQTRHATLGGAANVAANIAALGGQAILIGGIGADEAGTALRALLAAAPLIEDRLHAAPGRPTTTKTRFLAGNHQLLRLDEETTAPFAPADRDAVLAILTDTLSDAAVLVLSDYAKGLLCDDLLPAALAAAAAAGVPVIVDPKRRDLAAYRGAALLTPNEVEARAATGIDCATDDGAEAAARAIMGTTGCGGLLITRSVRGVTVLDGQAGPLHLPARARAVSDVTGAGDTLLAALALARATGASLATAAAVANVAAGLSVAKPGTATVGGAELEAALLHAGIAGADGKIAGAADAATMAARWRVAGLRVGFTNGCFDLVHPGHVRLLAQARAACDRLIVGLNTDASVRRLKGPSRPVQTEAARATVMASLAAVDCVVLFDEDTPLRLIEALRPDLLVKGADYTRDQVVGADRVAEWGGEVLLVPLEPGHSTTRVAERLRAG